VSDENFEIVRRGLEAFARRDVDGVLADLAPDFVFHPSGRFVDTQSTYVGHEGFAAFLDLFNAAWQDIEVRLDRLEELGDRVLALGYLHGHGGESGVEITAEAAWLYTIAGGRVIELQAFTTWQDALVAAGRG
jgi:ketosteroid isomerase-like protein